MALLLALATAMECRAALSSLSVSPSEHTLMPYAFNGHEILVCITGVGPVNAGIAVGRILALRPDIHRVYTVGLAGSFDLDRAPLCSAWRVNEEIYPEYGLVNESAYADARALGFAQYADIWDRIALPDPNIDVTHILPVAASLTVAGVTNSPRRALALYARYNALLENMEGFAVALACARAGVVCVEARVVSNRVGSRAPEHRAFADALDRLPYLMHTFFGTAST